MLLAGDGEKRDAALRLASLLDAYAQNHATTLVRPVQSTSDDFRSKALRLDLLLFQVMASCVLNGSVHSFSETTVGVPLSRLRAVDIPYVVEHGLARTTTPIIEMSARELVAHYRQLETHLNMLPYDSALVQYVDTLRVRCAMLLRAAWPYAAFDAREWCDARPMPASSSSSASTSSSSTPTTTTTMTTTTTTTTTTAAMPAGAAAASTTTALYVYSRRFLEDSTWLFAGVDARLYTAALWTRTSVAAAASETASLSFLCNIEERGAALGRFMAKASESLSIDLVNAQFRERFLVHSIRASERQRFLRDKSHATFSAAKILKTFRGTSGINTLLELADVDAKDAILGKSALDHVAVDMMRVRVFDAYANSFHSLPFEVRYVYYQEDIMTHYHGALTLGSNPLVVQTFTEFDLLIPPILSRAMGTGSNGMLITGFKDASETIAAWLLATLANLSGGSGIDSTNKESAALRELYAAVWPSGGASGASETRSSLSSLPHDPTFLNDDSCI